MREGGLFAEGESGREKVWGVWELVHSARLALETRWGEVWVEGEALNVRKPASGHWYFTLKDGQGQLDAVMYRSAAAGVRVALRDGLQVRVKGKLTVYEAGGRMQLQATRMEAAGVGALLAQLEELKRKLAAEGLFAAERKRALPAFPRHVGVVTSPTGAAIRDILNVLKRRFSNLHVVLAPVRVQGEGAAEEIAAGIRLLNRIGGLDVMIVGRGGGSLEDLWCFNEEVVARAIAGSAIPVISAVGHEIDTTLADYAADVRAPTPSAAAELVVKVKGEVLEALGAAGRRLAMAARNGALAARARLERARGTVGLGQAEQLVERAGQRVDLLGMRLQKAITGLPELGRRRVEGLGERMRARAEAAAEGARGRLERAGGRLAGPARASAELGKARVAHAAKLLEALSPLGVLARGYTMTFGEDGRLVRGAAGARAGARLRTKWADGEAWSVVEGGEREPFSNAEETEEGRRGEAKGKGENAGRKKRKKAGDEGPGLFDFA